MALSIGTRVGVYEVTGTLGEGGMGEVYRARDGTLHRDVALKILPEAFASDPDRLARFRREAQVLAALNHPNIAAIYGFDESTGVHALVLELVEGPTLADRIAHGPIPVDEALPIATQIAEALEAAHEHGIIHRDLKPANIKVRDDGTVKVLDFGLAKLSEAGGASGVGGAGKASGVRGAGGAGEYPLSHSPTITSPALMTGVGMILGTAAYMSPEQAKGRKADKRGDVWAFGVVLYEMLTGTRPFDGEDMTDVLGAVVRLEPKWEALPSGVPPPVRILLQQCLVKDRRTRVADIAAALFVLDHQTAAPAVAVRPRSSRVAWLVAAMSILALIITAIAAQRLSGTTTRAPDPIQFTIATPENTFFGGPAAGGTGTAAQIAVSPDGRNIAFVAGAQSAYQIWLRPLGAATARPLQGTEGGTFPFWSPDSRFVAFFAAGKLKKVAIAGGLPVVLADAASGRGGTWNRDDVILFSPTAGAGSALFRVGSAGGAPTTVTTPADAEEVHRWPHFLPDGRHFLYTASTGACCPPVRPGMINVGSLDPAEPPATLLQADSSATYAAGYVLYARGQTLMAQPFDPDARQMTGEAFPLTEGISLEGSRYVGVSISDNGTLGYAIGGSPNPLQLTWFDRTGRALGMLGDAAPDINLALSPDERQVAVAVRTGSPDNLDIWTIDIARGLRNRLTSASRPEGWPVWSPDGTRIVFGIGAPGLDGLPEKALLGQVLTNGTAATETLLEAADTPSRPCRERQCRVTPTDWSPDGRFVLYTLIGSFPVSSDIFALPLFGDRKPIPVAQTAFAETLGVFSPDQRWIAYTSNDAGQPNVYVQPFLRDGTKYQISPDRGSNPHWRADGRELFYLRPDQTMMAVQVAATDHVEAARPQALFPAGANLANQMFANQMYVVAKDGRFLVNTRPPQSATAQSLAVIVNWPATIQK